MLTRVVVYIYFLIHAEDIDFRMVKGLNTHILLNNTKVRAHVQTTWTNEGEGGAQMTTTLNNSYLVKVST